MQYTSKELADMIGVEPVTVRKYALALEKAGYIVERSAGDKRAYSEQDVTAFRHLVALRERSGMSVDMAASVIATRHREASDSIALAVQEEKSQDVQRYIEQYSEAAEARADARMIEFKKQLQQEVAATVADAIKADRGRRLDERFTEKRIEKQLRDEAAAAWNAKPEADRTRRVGWFGWGREEDTAARNQFIQDYIDERYEQRMIEAYGLEGKNDDKDRNITNDAHQGQISAAAADHS